MFCVKCGNQMDNGMKFCNKCGTSITGETPAVAPRPNVVVDDNLSFFIPKNNNALSAYYLGLFSFALFFLAIPGLVYGIKGWREARDNPAIGGAGHAMIGIICSLISIVGVIAIVSFILCFCM